MFKRLHQAVPVGATYCGKEVETYFLSNLDESIHLKQWTPLEKGSPMVPASLLTGMYQEWKVVEHKWHRKWPKAPTPDPMLSKIR